MTQDFYLPARYQHLCPQCLRPCIKTTENVLMDVSAQQVPTPWFEARPPGPHNADRGTVLMQPRSAHVLLEHRCTKDDLAWAARMRQNRQGAAALAREHRAVSAGADQVYAALTEQYAIAAEERDQLIMLGRDVKAQQETAALARSCPKCHAPAGAACWDLRRGREGQHTLHPHAGRIDRLIPVDATEQLQDLGRLRYARQDQIETAKQAIHRARALLREAGEALRRAGDLEQSQGLES